MGNKRGATIRAKKRADAAAHELLKQHTQKEESLKLKTKSDVELFVLDTSPDTALRLALAGKNKRRKVIDHSKAYVLKNMKQSKKHRVSKKYERQINQIMQRHSPEGVRELAASNRTRLEQRRRAKRVPGSSKASFDLWADPAKASNSSETKLISFNPGTAARAGTVPLDFKLIPKFAYRKDLQPPAKVSNQLLKARDKVKKNASKYIQVEPAQPGQSYRPDEQQHQDVIGEALDIELRRKEAVEKINVPRGGGKLSEETFVTLNVSSDDESSDDGEKEDRLNPTSFHKRKEKLTKAQRNKQKRARAEHKALVERKKSKKLFAAVNDSKTLAKALRNEENIRLTRREEIRALKEEKRAQPIGRNVFESLSKIDPINVPSLPVALTEELKENGGSLRSVNPKGSLLQDRMESMISRKMANRKKAHKKNVVEGKRRKLKPRKGGAFLIE